MLNNEPEASGSGVQLIAPQSLSAGANAGDWTAVAALEGKIMFVCQAGALTGSVTYKVQSADDAVGTGAADVAGAALTAMSTGDEIGVIVVDKSAIGNAYCTVIATVATGPALCSASLHARAKNVS